MKHTHGDAKRHSARGRREALNHRVAPSIQLIHSPEIKHADQDISEIVPAVGLQAVGRAYAKIIDEVNTLDREAVLAPPAASSR